MQKRQTNKNFIIIYTIIASIIIFFSNGVCHSQRTHQYIVCEAYKLLKKYNNNNDIPQLLINLGTNQTGNWLSDITDHGNPWVEGKIVVGAFREDEEDPVYKYGSEISIPVPGRIFWSSVTHFWQADWGDTQQNTLDLAGSNIPNAYQKITKYAYGGWDFNLPLMLYNFPTHSDGTGSCATQSAIVALRYNNLIDLYTQRNLYVSSVTWLGGQTVVFNNPIRLNNNNWSSLNTDLEIFKNIMVFEILGRMCHLLGDMSVSAHVHPESHPDGDIYEGRMGINKNDDSFLTNSFATYWNAERVWNTFSSIMEPYVSYDAPIHHLMYTMNQITGHFANIFDNGDDNYSANGNSNGIINAELSSYYPSGILPTTPFQYKYTDDFGPMRDAIFPHVIRATAGLLSWFARESRILPTFSGLLPKNEEWFDNTLQGDVIVPSGKTLTIRSGARINLNGHSITTTGDGIIVDEGAYGINIKVLSQSGIVGIYSDILQAINSSASGQSVTVANEITLGNNIIVPAGKTLTLTSTSDFNLNGYSIVAPYGTINNYTNHLTCAFLKSGGILKGIFPTIQGAINYSSTMQTIELQSRSYNESVNISNKTNILLIGTGNSVIENSLTINNSNIITISDVTINGLISTNSSSGVTVQYVNFASGGGIFYNYGGTEINLIQCSDMIDQGAAMAFTSYNGYGNISENSISGWDAGVYLNNNANFNITDNIFCQNGYDVYAQTGAGAYILNNTYSRALPGALYGVETFCQGSICTGNSLNKSKSPLLTGAERIEESDEAVLKYLHLIYQNSIIKGVNHIGALEFKSGINSLIDVIKGRLDIISDKSSFVKNIFLLDKLYTSIDSKNEFYNTISSLIINKKFTDYYPYLKRFEIQKEIGSKNYTKAGAIAEELLKIENNDVILLTELYYEKGLLNKYFLNDKNTAMYDLSAVINLNKNGVLAKFAKNELNDLGCEKPVVDAGIKISNSGLSLNNYPNPFNPTTKISYSIDQPGNVKLSVYNVLGQKIIDLVDGYKEKGSYFINFDASKLSSGVYIYTLQAGNKSTSNKMFLLK